MDRGGKSLLITYKHPKNYHSCTHNPEIGSAYYTHSGDFRALKDQRSNIGISVEKKKTIS